VTSPGPVFRISICRTEKPLWRQASMLADALADGAQQLEHFRTKSPFEPVHRYRRQHDKHTVGTKNAIGRQHMDVRVEGHQIAEGLNEQDQLRTTLDPGAGIGFDQQSLHDMAQLPEQSAPARKDRAQHSRHGEDVLPVRHSSQHVLLDPPEAIGPGPRQPCQATPATSKLLATVPSGLECSHRWKA